MLALSAASIYNHYINSTTHKVNEMTANGIYKKMIATAQTLPIAELKKQVVVFMADTSNEAGTMFNVLLTALENKMPEAEYVEFCDSL